MDRKFGISAGTLKIIAIVSMLIDHVGVVFLKATPYYRLFRNMGRLAFPIFCFLLVEGFFHTRDLRKYMLRLLVAAIISEVPFDMALYGRVFDPSRQNVLFTLLIGLIVLWSMEQYKIKLDFNYLALAAAAALVSYIAHTDYSIYGIASILIMYVFREYRILQAVAGALSFIWEPYACIAFLPVLLYNGEKGISLKYIFYAFYPAHLFLFACLRFWM
ncbi:MAG: conjugal transfer protein TraX [Lachnospiraceae bacterium]|nr:conjugal transfer protein TraX [Lachnospiraceae bacterium]